MRLICNVFSATVLLFALCGAALSVVAQTPTARPPTTILIIRHAEKLTDGRLDLSPTGFKRASLLPNLFVPAGVRPDLPTPQFIFATHQSPHSNRPVETVTPLATALNLPIDNTILNEDYVYSPGATLLGGKYAGKVVLVSWHHGTPPQLATALGVQPPYTLPGQTPSSTASGASTTRTARPPSRICRNT
jgi:hypothetical protein